MSIKLGIMASKTKRKSIIVMMMVAFVAAISANAQSVVNGINTRDAQACGEYLVNNPKDTISEKFNISRDGMRGEITRKVFLKGATTIGVRNDTVWYKQRVNKVEVNDNKVIVASTLRSEKGEVKGDTVSWTRTSSSDLSFATKESICRGETRIFDPEHKDYDGNFRHRTQATILGGGMLVDGYLTPTVTGRLGYETCHFLFDLEGSFASSKHTETAEYQGRYLSFSTQFSAGWKFWQDHRYRHYLAVLGTVGYGYQKTDGDEAVARSKNYGIIYGAMVRGSLGLTNRWRLVGELGYKIVPKVRHNEEQDVNNGGVFVNVGVGYAW